jgi:hypothetical protein
MKNQDEKIDRLFQSGLGNVEETPSSSTWNAIESQLPKKNNTNMYWIAASVAAVLIVSTIAWNSILERTSTFNYDTNNVSLNANYPQIEFTPLPILIHTTTIVYVDKEVMKGEVDTNPQLTKASTLSTGLSSAFDIKSVSDYYTLNTDIPTSQVELIYTVNEPITIIYKKGDPKHPKLAKAANFFKQVGDGERPLIDFEKISSSVIARRETNNNSNN